MRLCPALRGHRACPVILRGVLRLRSPSAEIYVQVEQAFQIRHQSTSLTSGAVQILSCLNLFRAGRLLPPTPPFQQGQRHKPAYEAHED
jgi:hypothetical protein